MPWARALLQLGSNLMLTWPLSSVVVAIRVRAVAIVGVWLVMDRIRV